jgi:hypothetical protein
LRKSKEKIDKPVTFRQMTINKSAVITIQETLFTGGEREIAPDPRAGRK